MGHLGNAALAGGALAGADYLTGNVVSGRAWEGIGNVVSNISGNVGSVVSGGAANTNAAPLLGSAAPLAMGATGIYSAYRGIKKTGEHGVIRGLQEGSLTFGAISGVGAMAGLMGTSALTSPLLATGLGIYGARKAWGLGSTFLQNPGENLQYGLTQPFKWSAGAVKSLFKGKSS